MSPSVYVKATPLTLGSRFLGMREADGAVSHPAILAMLQLDASWVEDDSTPWCSAFLNTIAWLLDLERSKSLAARSWLTVGRPVALEDAHPGFDVVIFKRGLGAQPGPEVLKAPGHVALFVERQGEFVRVLGGNQGGEVSIARFAASSILGIRRIQRAA